MQLIIELTQFGTNSLVSYKYGTIPAKLRHMLHLNIAVTLSDHEANACIDLILCGSVLLLRIYFKQFYLLETGHCHVKEIKELLQSEHILFLTDADIILTVLERSASNILKCSNIDLSLKVHNIF